MLVSIDAFITQVSPTSGCLLPPNRVSLMPSGRDSQDMNRRYTSCTGREWSLPWQFGNIRETWTQYER